MKNEVNIDQQVLREVVTNDLGKMGFSFQKELATGWLYQKSTKNLALLLDYNIQERAKKISYTEYTREQNYLMQAYRGLYRFSVDHLADLAVLFTELKEYLNDGVIREGVSAYGSQRELAKPDPTSPEFTFEETFAEVYGQDCLVFLKREQPFVDFYGRTRWLDYSLQTKKGRIAIELNGESFHHPGIISKDLYRSQLVKQNSLIASGFKVFRWSGYGMQNKEICAEEIYSYFGNKAEFIYPGGITANRKVFTLQAHQSEALKIISEQRAKGKNAFLVVLPTGVGKTEILFQDLVKQLGQKKQKALLLVPQINLKNQLLKYFQDRRSELSGLQVGENENADIMVQTYQYLARHYPEWPKDFFGYLALDEAHHAVAPAIKKILGHFNPETLVGLTATDQRFDQQKLETIFGEYETQMTLKEAVEKEILAPIRAFRIKSNLDLREIRYNGRDYVASDLQKRVIVPSRDQLIVDLLKKYFVSGEKRAKSGLLFCVSVKHSQSLAELLQKNGINAVAVNGQEGNEAAEKIGKYLNGEIQFLCTCQLLNEGWDAPRTEIIVMARPTMSKVLYQQQLGRGTRKYPGKEALYVIDIVDNYGAFNAPWSVHALFGISTYRPGELIVGKSSAGEDELVLAGFFEEVRNIEEINIFTFEQKYAGFLSPEQLARELFVSTETILKKRKSREIIADLEIPFGNRNLAYFSPERVEELRVKLDLREHNEKTIYQDFFNFIEKGDYTFSYKIVFLLSFFKHINKLGECDLEVLTSEYQDFYLQRWEAGLVVERPNSPYNNPEYLRDFVEMKRSLLQNPFEKFERKRFIYHCRDLQLVAFSSALWKKLRENEGSLERIRMMLEADRERYFAFGEE